MQESQKLDVLHHDDTALRADLSSHARIFTAPDRSLLPARVRDLFFYHAARRKIRPHIRV